MIRQYRPSWRLASFWRTLVLSLSVHTVIFIFVLGEFETIRAWEVYIISTLEFAAVLWCLQLLGF